MTLMEVIVVMVMIGVATVFCLPNFTSPTERAKAVSAQNNLLAIYTAQQNYNVNNNTTAFCTTANGICGSLASINSNLSLNIQDDGTYNYSCVTSGGAPQCTATRNNSSANLTLDVSLNQPIKLTTQTGNPSCGPTTGNTNWCP